MQLGGGVPFISENIQAKGQNSSGLKTSGPYIIVVKFIFISILPNCSAGKYGTTCEYTL